MKRDKTEVVNQAGKKLVVSISDTPSKKKQGRPSVAVRVKGAAPIFFKSRDEADNYRSTVVAAHMQGGTYDPAERGTVSAAIDHYCAVQEGRYKADAIAWTTMDTNIRNARDWIETRDKIVKAEFVDLPADHWKCRSKGRYLKDDQGAFVWDITPRVGVGSMPLDTVSKKLIRDEWLESFFDDRDNKTKREKLTALKCAFDLAVDEGWCLHNPAAQIALDADKYGQSEEEIEEGAIVRLPPAHILKIINEAEKVEPTVGNVKWCYSLAIAFFAHTGLRVGEFCALKWKFVDFENERIYVRTAARREPQGEVRYGQPKQVKKGLTRGRRSVFLTPELVKALREWKMRSPKSGDDDRVFQRHTLTVFKNTQSLLRETLYPACDAAGVDPLNFLDLRHFFASLCVSEYGDNWERIADLMGHESTATTRKHYAEWIDNEKRDRADAAAYGERTGWRARG